MTTCVAFLSTQEKGKEKEKKQKVKVQGKIKLLTANVIQEKLLQNG